MVFEPGPGSIFTTCSGELVSLEGPRVCLAPSQAPTPLLLPPACGDWKLLERGTGQVNWEAKGYLGSLPAQSYLQIVVVVMVFGFMDRLAESSSGITVVMIILKWIDSCRQFRCIFELKFG